MNYVKWYIGSGLEAELMCVPCAEHREGGLPAEAESVCEECFDYATTEVGDLVETRGKPGIRIRSEPFDSTLKETALPKEVPTIVDIAPVDLDGRPIWLLLAEDGLLIRLDADTRDWAKVASANVGLKRLGKPWNGRVLRRRLHASKRGEFVAVVDDYGRYGQVVDLRSGRVTIELDGGNYHAETVPFSFSFADTHGQVAAIHRTAWNRLDVSDPLSGKLLTERGPTSYRSGEVQPEHYLDYFHGALYVSPGGAHILDDGWVWAPVGVPTVWSVDRWTSDNVWESEDGLTKKDLCARSYYWDHAVSWLDDRRVAVAGIGDDDIQMVDGARIFDVTSLGSPNGRQRGHLRWAREVTAFPGPAGAFFSDETRLFSSDETGLSRWDPEEGVRTPGTSRISARLITSAARASWCN
jgi:hypothetical protein